jgi:DNA primase
MLTEINTPANDAIDDFAQLVKQQADIVRIVGEYVKLRKTGAQNYTGLCPFHKEKTGSFSVNATHGYYYCFGCHEKGDVFTFVMKMDRLSFPEAVRAVAPRRNPAAQARVQLARRGARGRPAPPAHRPARGRDAVLRGAAEVARSRARPRVPHRPRRHAPRPSRVPHRLRARRLQRHARPAEAALPRRGLRASGLFSAKEQADGSPGPMYARFRKRITFPIANEQGKVIAFTARALDARRQGRPVAKYLNSPGDRALHQGPRPLQSRQGQGRDAQAHDFALLVEGQMDCISVYMAGIHNVLATSGTAFTEMQVRLLSRFTKRVIVNFDPDTAGATAAEKSIALLTEEDFEVKVITLEGGLDPDRFVREHGIQAYMAALRAAKRHSDYLIDRARQLFPARTADAKVKALNFLLPHIRRMPNRIQRDEFAADAAQKLGIDSALMRQELKQAAAQRTASVPRPPGRAAHRDRAHPAARARAAAAAQR